VTNTVDETEYAHRIHECIAVDKDKHCGTHSKGGMTEVLTLSHLGVNLGEVAAVDEALALITLAGDDHGLDLRVENNGETDPGENGSEDSPECNVLDVVLGSELAHVDEDTLMKSKHQGQTQTISPIFIAQTAYKHRNA
jgi:hypothetical protein